jgi:transposase
MIHEKNSKSNHLQKDGYKKDLLQYDHYVAVDWSNSTMALARLTRKSDKAKVIETRSDITLLREHLESLTGKVILTIEETTTSHWLYTELHESVHRIVICDPYWNRVISFGPKNDRIDAEKLCRLLKQGLLTEVYHTTDQLSDFRKLDRAYVSCVKAGVRLKNQRSALYRGMGRTEADRPSKETERFILDHIDSAIESYEQTKKEYTELFKRLCRQHAMLRLQCSIPGIDKILAFRIVASVIDAHRFPRAGHYLAYCGLVKHEKLSGSRSYGRRTPRYSRSLKNAYKTAAVVAIRGENPVREYFEHLLSKGVAEHNARHAVARYIARLSYGIMKGKEKYKPYRWRRAQTVR